ncbi:CinA family protein [Spiroplasma sp. DGKH1]|uniref:CinA family protein n=1 Tax=Spiroplasma sp. DGKH1 TaxID=3050074 RepID=UPI0034C5D63C
MFKELVESLIKQKLTIATYESLTGGLFTSLLTDVPHASLTVKGSLVTYTNAIKVQVGHVNAETIDQYGVVSAETAFAMAQACQKLFASDISVSFTGNAGPGVLDNLPVGVVYCCICYNDKTYPLAFNFNPTLTRGEIKLAVCQAVCKELLKIVEKN